MSASATTAERREAVIEFLRRHGAATTPHIFGDLLSHLVGVETLVRSWGGSDMLALAALGHATYGTHGFEPYILERDERSELVDAIGPEAEALVYFYASCDRGRVLSAAHLVGHRPGRPALYGPVRRHAEHAQSGVRDAVRRPDLRQ